MGFLLFLISLVLKRILEPFIYIQGSFVSYIKGGKKEWNKYNMNLAVSIDQYGNGLSKYLFNKILIKKTSVNKFGNIDETISSVIGKNKLAGTLTWVGKFLDTILDCMESDHSIKSIDNTENE
jgi:8-oxo-dGTP diphosphatase